MTVVALQIGNAVPPLLAACVSTPLPYSREGGNGRPLVIRPPSCLVSRNGA
jgi:hypothetical protein